MARLGQSSCHPNGAPVFSNGTYNTAISVGAINTSSRDGRAGDVILLQAGQVGHVNVSSIDSSSLNGQAGSVAISSGGNIYVGTTNASSPVIDASSTIGQDGSIFLSAGGNTQGAGGQSIIVGAAANQQAIRAGGNASILAVSAGDISIGNSLITGYMPSTRAVGGFGAFARVVSDFPGFPVLSDSANYTVTATPQALPTISDGTNTYILPAGNFLQITPAAGRTDRIATTGNLIIDTNGDANLLVPFIAAQINVGGSVIGATGANGSAAPIVLYSHETMSLATNAITDGVRSLSTAVRRCSCVR